MSVKLTGAIGGNLGTSREIQARQHRRLEVSGTYADGRIRSTSYVESERKARGNGEIDLENPAAKGRVEFGESYRIGSQTEIDINDDTTYYRKHQLSINSGGRAGVEVSHGASGDGIDQSQAIEVGLSSDVTNVTTNGVKSKDGTFAEWESEQKLYADSHAKTENKVVVNQDEVTIKSGFDLQNEAGVSDKETLRVGTADGSQMEVFGEGSYAAGGSAKGGFEFSRKNEEGTTEFGLHAGGPIPVVPGLGVGVGFKVKLKDEDLERAFDSNNPVLPTQTGVALWNKASQYLDGSSPLASMGGQFDSWG